MKAATRLAAPPLIGPPEARLMALNAELAAAAASSGYRPPTLVAVSKTFGPEAIRPLIAAGQRVFGENRVQEAEAKWPELQAETPGIELHLVGQLQSNKAQAAVQLFDWIHSLDRSSLAIALARAIDRTGRRPRLFVQVNLDGQPHKGGVAPDGLEALLRDVRALGLAPEGLMTVPPEGLEPAPYFALLARLARRHGLPLLSMGMSQDRDIAARLGATHVRVGSALFGARVRPAAVAAL
jgi:hypothetical protein